MTTRRKGPKCSRSTTCTAMTAQVQRGGFRKAPGLQWCITQSIHPKTGDITTKILGIVCRQNAKDRGILFNVCPWCGEPINWVTRPVKRRPRNAAASSAAGEMT